MKTNEEIIKAHSKQCTGGDDINIKVFYQSEVEGLMDAARKDEVKAIIEWFAQNQIQYIPRTNEFLKPSGSLLDDDYFTPGEVYEQFKHPEK